MCIPNDCPPQAIFLDLALCECNFPLKNNVFYRIWVLKSLKFSGLRPAKFPFFFFQIPKILFFFSPRFQKTQTPPPPGGGGYEKHCLRPNVSHFLVFGTLWFACILKNYIMYNLLMVKFAVFLWDGYLVNDKFLLTSSVTTNSTLLSRMAEDPSEKGWVPR